MGVSEVQQRDKMKRAMINKAIRSKGFKFITLIMVSKIANRIHGAHILYPYPTVDGSTNETTYDFKIGGGRLEFSIDEALGEMTCKLLDCEHNRKFLASQMGTRYWEIENDRILEEIKALARSIRKKAVVIVEEPVDKPDVIPDDIPQEKSEPETTSPTGPSLPDSDPVEEETEPDLGNSTSEEAEEVPEQPKPTKGKGKGKVKKQSFATFEE